MQQKREESAPGTHLQSLLSVWQWHFVVASVALTLMVVVLHHYHLGLQKIFLQLESSAPPAKGERGLHMRPHVVLKLYIKHFEKRTSE